MSRDYWQPAAAQADVPDLPQGTVLIFLPDEMRYERHKMRLRLDQVRDDLSQFHDGEMWLEGWIVGADGMPLAWRQILVQTAAIEAAVRRAAEAPGL